MTLYEIQHKTAAALGWGDAGYYFKTGMSTKMNKSDWNPMDSNTQALKLMLKLGINTSIEIINGHIVVTAERGNKRASASVSMADGKYTQNRAKAWRAAICEVICL